MEAQDKGERLEAVLNAAGSVWDVDTLVRPPLPPQEQQRSRHSGVGVDGGGGTVTGSDLFLAVGTGPLRQTDQPIDEVGLAAGIIRSLGFVSLFSSSPPPLPPGPLLYCMLLPHRATVWRCICVHVTCWVVHG